MFSRIFFPGVFLCLAVGCSSGLGAVVALRQYSAGQKEITHYVKNEEDGFNMLVLDIEKNNIKTGLRYSDVLRRYGEPVITWDIQPPSLISKKLLYRKPIDYFSTSRAYLYIDNSGSLMKWEYYPVLKINMGDADAKKNN